MVLLQESPNKPDPVQEQAKSPEHHSEKPTTVASKLDSVTEKTAAVEDTMVAQSEKVDATTAASETTVSEETASEKAVTSAPVEIASKDVKSVVEEKLSDETTPEAIKTEPSPTNQLTQPLSPTAQYYLRTHHQRQQSQETLPPSPPPDFMAPHSLEAEEALLGGLIINPYLYDEVATFLKPSDFFFVRNSWMFEAIGRIRARNEAVELLTLNEEFRSQNRLHEMGANYGLYLLNNTPNSTHAVVYGKIVERAAIRRRLVEAAGSIANIANSGNRDIHEVIHDAELALANVTDQRSSQQIVVNYDGPKSFISDLMDRMELQDTDGVTGVRVGYKHLDQLLGGLQAGELYVVAGRSKSGKSAFLLNMTRGAAANGSSIGFFSLEMNLNQLQRRLHAIETGINTQKMRLGALSSDEFKEVVLASNRVKSYDIYWDETPRISVLELRSKCRYLKRRYGINMVVVDYLQLLKPADASLRRDNRERQLATISEMLKEMARELNLAVLVAAQLNREVFKSDNKRPRIEHIRDSDAIVHNADVVMLWHCPQTVDENAPKTGASKLYIEKHRDGPQTELDFQYELGCQRIKEVVFETVDLSTY